ncbi:MAG: metallophosphoesterase [Candidatus Diapherotrites archaeon]|nr:metallophosphoesterase [Candidatus Diapherotrites archaeon]
MSPKLPEKKHFLPVEIIPGFHALDLGLYIPSEDCLIISDLQLGLEEQYNQQGIFIPRFNYKEVKQHLLGIFEKKENFSRIILNGDIKHGFGKASNQEWREVIDLLETISPHAGKITLIKGNHDIALDPIARFAKLHILKEGLFLPHANAYVCHGHEIPKEAAFQKAQTIIIGHDHPAIQLQDGATRQKYKCFLSGTWEGKQLIVLPGFNFAHMGSDPREGALSPFLQQRLDHFRAWLVEDHVYEFGMLGDI